jgi:hypothetical protein
MSDLTSAELGAAERLTAMINGYHQTCVIVAASHLGVFKHLASGPVAEEILAKRVCADPPSLHRLLRALKALSLVDGDGEVELTGMGRLLVPDGCGLAEMSILVGAEYLRSWADLPFSVETGLPSFKRIFGMTAWEHRKRHPELGEAFNRMTSGHAHNELKTITNAYDFSVHRHVVDVGGGSGYLLNAILERYPSLRATLFDLPQVVEAPVVVEDRCAVVGGSFFDRVPAGGDLYILKHILHDWDDDASAAILRRVREAIAPGGTLLVIESILPNRDFDDPAVRPIVMLDLHMMTVLGGRERGLSEYERLLTTTGFELSTFAAGLPCVLCARPA